MSKSSEALTATFVRNGVAKSTGDLRYTLDPERSDVEDVEVKGRSMSVMPIPIGNDKVIRRTINRNVYVPADQADESVESFTLQVGLGSVQRNEAKPSSDSGDGEADPVFDALVAKGDVEALAEYLAATRDGIGPKRGRIIAETLCS